MCNTENEREWESIGVVSTCQSSVDQLGISSKHSIFASRGQLAPIRGVALSFNITKLELRKTSGFRSNVSHQALNSHVRRRLARTQSRIPGLHRTFVSQHLVFSRQVPNPAALQGCIK